MQPLNETGNYSIKSLFEVHLSDGIRHIQQKIHFLKNSYQHIRSGLTHLSHTEGTFELATNTAKVP